MGNIVFAGTALFAVPTLQGLVAAGHHVKGVITQPDKPVGRGHTLQPSPVKQAALELHLPVHQPTTLRDQSAEQLFQTLHPELIVVVAYGKIIPGWLLSLPAAGIVNLHGSLLPKYRGAAPIQWAVANGETETGVCTMRIDQGLDTGPVYFCERTTIAPDETVRQLSGRLATIGAELMNRTVAGIFDGTATLTPQDHSRATQAPILRRTDGNIDWRLPARTIHNRIRGFQPWPGAVTLFRETTCKILKAVEGSPEPRPSIAAGTIESGKRSLTVVCGDGLPLEVLELQLPGRKPWPASAFINNMRIEPGEKFHPVTDN